MSANNGERITSVVSGSADERTDVWKCRSCGIEYTADIGHCGQLQPKCYGKVERVSRAYTDADIIAALRLAIEAAATDSAARSVTVDLLALASPSDNHATAPVEALIVAIKAAGLGFEVTDS